MIKPFSDGSSIAVFDPNSNDTLLVKAPVAAIKHLADETGHIPLEALEHLAQDNDQVSELLSKLVF